MYTLTNPNSIYIKGTFRFAGYKQIDLHCYVDTGASLCLASKHVIPAEHWINAPKVIRVKTANGPVYLNKKCSDLQIRLAGQIFHIPSVYQQENGIDFILGNNFCLLYRPFIQNLRTISLHNKGVEVSISKITNAYFHGKHNFLESMKINSRTQKPEPINIAQNQIDDKKDIEDIEEYQFIANQEKFSTIEKLLEKVCSENPIDPIKCK